jgi:plastocyanin
MKILLLAALAAALLVPAATAGTTTLNGTVGPGFTITLKKAGKNVKTLPAGLYVFKIADKSSIHNFHLTGPGFNRKTSVGAVKNETWRIHLRKGTYKYVCDPHKSIMHGSFKVT